MYEFCLYGTGSYEDIAFSANESEEGSRGTAGAKSEGEALGYLYAGHKAYGIFAKVKKGVIVGDICAILI